MRNEFVFLTHSNEVHLHHARFKSLLEMGPDDLTKHRLLARDEVLPPVEISLCCLL